MPLGYGGVNDGVAGKKVVTLEMGNGTPAEDLNVVLGKLVDTFADSPSPRS